MKIRQLLLMLVPCLLLSLGAWKLQNREVVSVTPTPTPTPTIAPLQMRITAVGRQPVKPIEAAAGYDTRIVVTVTQGKALVKQDKSLYLIPGVYKAQLVRKQDKKPLSLPVRCEIGGQRFDGTFSTVPQMDQMREQTELAFALPLNKVPSSAGAVVLSARIVGRVCEEKTDSSGVFRSSGNHKSVIIPLEVPVQHVGETIVKKRSGSKKSNLRLEKTEVRRLGFVGSVAKIQVRYIAPAPKAQPPNFQPTPIQFDYDEVRVIDETGRVFPLSRSSGLHPFTASVMSISNPTKPQERTFRIEIGVQTNMLRDAKGQLTLKALISANGGWPLPISVIIRKKGEP